MQVLKGKKFILVAGLCMSMGAAAHAGTFEKIYFGNYMGLKIPQPQLKSNFAGALGFKLNSDWRIESEFSERSEDLTQYDAPVVGGFKSWSGLVNLYYDFKMPGKFESFAGAGVGYTSTQDRDNRSDGNFAWQVGGGLQYIFNPDLAFSSAYRFIDGGPAPYAIDDETGSHEIRFGISYKLPLKPAHHPRGLNEMKFQQ